MTGKDLLFQLIASTGLPEKAVEAEMQRLIKESQYNLDELDMDALREILVNYLQDTLVDAKKHFAS